MSEQQTVLAEPGVGVQESKKERVLARTPIAIARSELFSVTPSGPWSRARVIATAKKGVNASIVYTGQHLNMEHLRAWQALVYLADRHSAIGGDGFVVPAAEVLRHMGKNGADLNSTQRKQFWQLLTDLRATAVEITSNGVSYVGGLIDEAEKDEATKMVRVKIGEKIANKLLDREILRNDVERMTSLGRHYLAIWLHGFIASQSSSSDKKPSKHVFAVDELRRICGSTTKKRIHFVQKLAKALDKLKEGEGALLKDWGWLDDAKTKVYVVKAHTLVKLLGETKTVAADKRQQSATEAAAKSRARVAL